MHELMAYSPTSIGQEGHTFYKLSSYTHTRTLIRLSPTCSTFKWSLNRSKFQMVLAPNPAGKADFVSSDHSHLPKAPEFGKNIMFHQTKDAKDL